MTVRKVLWKINLFLHEYAGKELKFSSGWVMGAYTPKVIWLNEKIAQTKHPTYNLLTTLLHELLHSLEIKQIDQFIDWLLWIQNKRVERRLQ